MYSPNEEPTAPYLYPSMTQPPRRGGSGALIAALLLGAVGGGAAGAVVARTTTPTVDRTVYVQQSAALAAAPAATTALRPLHVIDSSDRAVQVVKRVGPAVVTIQTAGVDPTTGGQFQSSGSGVFIDAKGDILTNNHVVQNGSTFKVVFQSGATATGQLVGTDVANDLAVLHVDGRVPAWAPLGDSDAVEPGQTVLAIGSPLGSFENSVTEGIISAKNRTLQESSGPSLTGVLQTDAPINHGNSGGPLVDLNGTIIGINTAVVRSPSDTTQQSPLPDPFGGFFSSSDPASGDQAQGLGFAIPSKTARIAISRILFHLPEGYLGVKDLQTVDPQVAALYGLPTGVYVRTVEPGSPADRAGIRPKDIITTLDGQALDQNNSLPMLIAAHQPGQKVRVTLFRAGQTLTLTVTLGARPTQ